MKRGNGEGFKEFYLLDKKFFFLRTQRDDVKCDVAHKIPTGTVHGLCTGSVRALYGLCTGSVKLRHELIS
jgi:hypothetical protein